MNKFQNVLRDCVTLMFLSQIEYKTKTLPK
jgi:hypothetical protein